MTRVIGAIVVTAFASSATADGVKQTAEPEPPGRHLVYVELLGKGGAYGLGYELSISPRFSVGTAVSYVSIRDQQIATVAPYVHASALRFGKNALFGELGATFVHSRIPSPVPDWDGMSESGAGGFASVGWERAWQHLTLRTSGSIVAGEGGLAPWLGVAIGYRP
ncbi:MAG TPA: hypothetical protein VIU61_15855 [Kofleriaceae bacterium]